MSMTWRQRASLAVSALCLGALSAPTLALCERTFAVTIDTQSTFALTQQNDTMQQSVRLSIRPLPNTPLPDGQTGQWLGIQVEPIASSGTAASAMEPSIPPFGMLFDPYGVIVDQMFLPGLSDAQRQQAMGYAYWLQVPQHTTSTQTPTIPAKGIRYQDNNGQFEPQFIMSEPTQLAYRNTGYLSVDPQLGQDIVVEEAQASYQLDACGFADFTQHTWLTYTHPASAQLSLRAQQHVQGKVIPADPDTLLWQLPDNLRLWRTAPSTPLSETQRNALTQQLEKWLNTTDWLNQPPGELSEALRAFDAVLDYIPELLLHQGWSDAQQMRIIHALGLLDTPRAQSSLVSMLTQDAHTETNQFRALRALTQGETALSEEAVLALMAHTDVALQRQSEMDNALLLHIGILYDVRPKTALSAKLLNGLHEALHAAPDHKTQATLIAAVGNTAHPDSVKILARFQHATDPAIVDNLAFSLGQIQGEQSLQVLTHLLTREEVLHKASVIGALHAFDLDVGAMQTITTLAEHNTDHQTRRAAIKTLGAQTHRKTEAAAMLRHLLQNEPNKANFKRAAKAIAELEREGG